MQADYVLDYDVVSMEDDRRVYLMMRVRGKSSPQQTARRLMNLSVVLDRSGSMAGDKMDYVKQATQFLIKHLSGDDRFSVVTYDAVVNVDIQPTPVVNKDMLSASVERIQAGGTTNLSGGWLQGCQLVADHLGDNQSNRVLLLTDGLANQGITDHDRLEQMARQKREEGVTTTTMGVGMNFNEDLLRRMAAAGGGAFYFIDNPDQAPAIFQEELQDLLNVVGQNLQVSLWLEPAIRFVSHLNAYPSDTDGDWLYFRMGDLYADEVKTLLMELDIPALLTTGERQIGRVRFDYDEITDEGVQHQQVELPLMVSGVSRADFEGEAPNAEVVKAALLLKAARAREESIKEADRGNFERASEILTNAADEIDQAQIEDEALQSQHDMLREEAVDMELGPQRYDSHTRKVSSTKSHHVERTERYLDQTRAIHARLKQTRGAMERNGETPTGMRWQRNHLAFQDYTDSGEVRIGRGQENDVVIDEKSVSKFHCRIFTEDDQLYLEDLDSKNGTYANGGRLKPGARFRLSRGDVITIGAQLFRLE